MNAKHQTDYLIYNFLLETKRSTQQTNLKINCFSVSNQVTVLFILFLNRTFKQNMSMINNMIIQLMTHMVNILNTRHGPLICQFQIILIIPT